ncbi:MAG: dihydrofolate reductase [Cyclobacteriaceae bacterium]|nr:dihydrofolate reductase [Cyclobacteriaceae bacterium]
MRKVILGVAVSLDGYIEGPKGEFDWCFTDQDYGMSEFFKRIDALFMGRKSFELAQSMGGESPWKGITTYVFSNTLKTISVADTRLVSGDTLEEVKKIKESPGKDIWLFGGAELTSSLMNANLVDECWLSVHPILLGGGKPLFQSLKNRKNLVLLKVNQYATGLVSLCYGTS